MSARALLGGLRLVEIPMPYRQRVGQSKLRVVSDGVRFARVILHDVLCYRPERLFLMAFAVCLVVGMLWAAYPLEYYIANRRVEEWMIYRFLVCGLLGSAGYQLLAGTALAHRMARFGPPRQTTDSFWPVLVAKFFEGWPLVAFITVCTAASLGVLWPGLAEYAATGHVHMHWSRLVTGTFGLVVAPQEHRRHPDARARNLADPGGAQELPRRAAIDRQRQEAAVKKPTGNSGGRCPGLVWVLAAFGLYLLFFMAEPMQSLGGALRRGQWIGMYLLLPDMLVSQWFPSPGGPVLLDRILPFSVSLGVLAVAGMLGYVILAALRIDRETTGLEQLFFSAAVGLNLVSTWTLAVGLLGGLGNRLWLLAPVPVILAGFFLAVRQRRWARPPRAAPAPEMEAFPLSRHWLWVAGVFALFILLGGILPPNEFDVREYHLQAPKEFFAAGRISFLPHNLYGNMALGAEMHPLLGMVLLGDWWTGALVGKTIIAMFAPLTALGLLAAGRRLYSPAAGVIAAIVYLSTPWTMNLSAYGFIEGALGMYLFAATYALIIWRGGGRRAGAWLLLSGYLAGGAVACKYTALPFVAAPLGGWLLWQVFVSRRGGSGKPFSWLAPVLFTVAALAGCGLQAGKELGPGRQPHLSAALRAVRRRTWTPEKTPCGTPSTSPMFLHSRSGKQDLWRVAVGSDWLSSGSSCRWPRSPCSAARNGGSPWGWRPISHSSSGPGGCSPRCEPTAIGRRACRSQR